MWDFWNETIKHRKTLVPFGVRLIIAIVSISSSISPLSHSANHVLTTKLYLCHYCMHHVQCVWRECVGSIRRLRLEDLRYDLRQQTKVFPGRHHLLGWIQQSKQPLHLLHLASRRTNLKAQANKSAIPSWNECSEKKTDRIGEYSALILSHTSP